MTTEGLWQAEAVIRSLLSAKDGMTSSMLAAAAQKEADLLAELKVALIAYDRSICAA